MLNKAQETTVQRPREGAWQGAARICVTTWQFVRTKPLGAVGGVVLLAMVIAAVFAPVIATHDPLEQDHTIRLQAPSYGHWLGTDQAGRDMFSRVVYGARTSVAVGFSVVVLNVLLSFTVGTLSAYRGGLTDLLLQRIVDAMQAIPTLVFLMAASVVVGRGMWTLVFLLAMVTGWSSSRVVRSAVLSIKQNDYVAAARAMGASDLRIILVHIAPNVFAPVMVLATVLLGSVILLEASLSFLGVGVEPPAITWGQMLSLTSLGSGSVMQYMTEAPWLAIVPGVAIALAVWGINMLGDALRDVLDPRMRGTS